MLIIKNKNLRTDFSLTSFLIRPWARIVFHNSIPFINNTVYRVVIAAKSLEEVVTRYRNLP